MAGKLDSIAKSAFFLWVPSKRFFKIQLLAAWLLVEAA